MPRVSDIQTSFTSGELDPMLVEREDIKFYRNGAERLVNLIVKAQGGVTRRGGLRRVASLGTPAYRRFIPFAFSRDQSYCIIASNALLTIFRNESQVDTVTIPHTAVQLADTGWTQSLDTLLLFHNDIQPRRVVRGATDADWTISTLNFSNMLGYDYGAVTPTGTLDTSLGETTDGDIIGWSDNSVLVYSSANVFTAGMVGWEIKTDRWGGRIVLFNDAGEVGMYIFLPDPVTSGERDMRKTSYWNLLEPIMSTARGWPSCATFYQGRLIVAGLKALPQTIVASVVDEYFNFDRGAVRDDRAWSFTVDADQAVRILHLFPGNRLFAFTENQEFYVPTEPLTPKNIGFRSSSRVGIRSRLMRPFDIGGSVIFVNAAGSALQEYAYTDEKQNFVPANISLLAPHLMFNPIDIAVRAPQSQQDGSLVLMVNGPRTVDIPTDIEDLEGTVTMVTSLRDQNVTAFSRLVTREGDKIKRVVALDDGNIYFIVERVLNGTATDVLEIWDDDYLLDGGSIYTVPSQTYIATASQTAFVYSFADPADVDHVGVTVDGIELDAGTYSLNTGTNTVTLTTGVAAGAVVVVSHKVTSLSVGTAFNGETLTFSIDGSPAKTAVVSAGSVTLPTYALRQVQWGFPFGRGGHETLNVWGRTMPHRPALADGTVMGKKKRIVQMTPSLYRTGGLALGANGRAPKLVPLRRFGPRLLDQAISDNLVTGIAQLDGTMGWSERGQIEFGVDDPVPFTLRAIAYKVSV